MPDLIIFTREQYDEIKRQQRFLTDLLPQIDRVEACGTPCGVARQKVEELLSGLVAIEREFMTPPPK